MGSDESRTMQWRAAIEGFEKSSSGRIRARQPRSCMVGAPQSQHLSHDTDVYDRTHNQYLELLATTGSLGALTFLGIWLAIGVTLVRAYRDDRLSASSLGILAALQVAYATYLFFWFVDLNSTMLWILFAALIASRENPYGVVRAATQKRAMPAPRAHYRAGGDDPFRNRALSGVLRSGRSQSGSRQDR